MERKRKEILVSTEPYELEYRLLHHSGEYRWLRLKASPKLDESGQVIRWYGTFADIHVEKIISLERELVARELDHRIKNLLALMNGLVSLCARPRISFSHGAAWKTLISRYMETIPPSGDACAPEHSIRAASSPEMSASSAATAKVGDAAKASQSAALDPAALPRAACPPASRQQETWLTASRLHSVCGTPSLRSPTPRPTSRRVPCPPRSCRASSTICRSASGDSPRASPPTLPAGPGA